MPRQKLRAAALVMAFVATAPVTADAANATSPADAASSADAANAANSANAASPADAASPTRAVQARRVSGETPASGTLLRCSAHGKNVNWRSCRGQSEALGVGADPSGETAGVTGAEEVGDGANPGTTVADNPFLPRERNIGDCASSLPRPDCGSDARGGWQQATVFGVLMLGMAFIGWRVFRSVRRRDRQVHDPAV